MSTKPKAPVSSLIGLGGNVGDVVVTMQRALNRISAHEHCELISVSKVYRTPPWGKTDQDWFFNACADVHTSLAPEDFLDLLLAIEISEGRVRNERWGPRTLDLDIITYGDAEIHTARLNVPHPRMTERAFVMVPLLDIAGDRMISGKPAHEHATGIDRGGIETADEVLTILSN